MVVLFETQPGVAVSPSRATNERDGGFERSCGAQVMALRGTGTHVSWPVAHTTRTEDRLLACGWFSIGLRQWFSTSLGQWFSTGLGQWFSTGLGQWFSTGLGQWFSTGLGQWFSIGLRQWFSTGLGQWFSISLRQWFSTGLGQWFSTGLGQWFSTVLSNGCWVPTSFLTCMATLLSSSLSRQRRLMKEVGYPTSFSASDTTLLQSEGPELDSRVRVLSPARDHAARDSRDHFVDKLLTVPLGYTPPSLYCIPRFKPLSP
ncbi:hypothetical protein EYF80_019815 [Liparis tanakae]|uniref:Uncharacterized protein n=1 Tax=Liparis tanakae TaxID=230148 RepID=A0A4Z2HYD1_9TELE|nr:hypothetical protein EYF80_019815 [Liparis tanakae]